MFRRIVVAVQAPDQGALDLVQQLATEGVTEVQVLHLRERELSGPIWYSRESGREAGYLIEAAVFELRMAGIAAAGTSGPRSSTGSPRRYWRRPRPSAPTSSSWAARAAGKWPPACSAA